MQNPAKYDDNAPWYKQKIFWMLMAGPIIVVFAALATLYIAGQNADDLVSDDYYKDGKHINLQIERDTEAAKRNILAQVWFNGDGTAAKVFISGDFNPDVPLKLLLLHPAKKTFDQTVPLQRGAAAPSGDKTEYSARFSALPSAVHWYVRIEDDGKQWRVENKWLPKQGGTVELKPKKTLQNAAQS